MNFRILREPLCPRVPSVKMRYSRSTKNQQNNLFYNSRKYTILLIFLLTAAIAPAQSAGDTDSLLQLLTHAKEDTNKVKLLLDIEKNYFSSDLDSALYYNQACETLIEKINAPQLKHRCYRAFVKIYHAKFEYKSAWIYCLKPLEVAKQGITISRKLLLPGYHTLRLP